jgi:hypothetical protein
MQKREIRGKSEFKGPSSSGEWVTGHGGLGEANQPTKQPKR